MAKRGFTVHHNGPPARCVGKPHTRCLAFWEAVRRFHVEDKGWSGIAYSFGCCPHGEVLVGQGWNNRQFANGADLVGANNGTDADWYTVLVFVGGDVSTGDEEPPTAQMIQATADLIGEGRRTGRCGTQVLPHKDFKQKPCPGSAFTALCREWHNRPLPTAKPAPALPILQEDDDMVIVITAPNKPPRAIVQGKLIGFRPDPKGGSQYTDFRAALVKAKVPIVDWVCDVAQYDAMSETYGTPVVTVGPPVITPAG